MIDLAFNRLQQYQRQGLLSDNERCWHQEWMGHFFSVHPPLLAEALVISCHQCSCSLSRRRQGKMPLGTVWGLDEQGIDAVRVDRRERCVLAELVAVPLTDGAAVFSLAWDGRE